MWILKKFHDIFGKRDHVFGPAKSKMKRRKRLLRSTMLMYRILLKGQGKLSKHARNGNLRRIVDRMKPRVP